MDNYDILNVLKNKSEYVQKPELIAVGLTGLDIGLELSLRMSSYSTGLSVPECYIIAYLSSSSYSSSFSSVVKKVAFEAFLVFSFIRIIMNNMKIQFKMGPHRPTT